MKKRILIFTLCTIFLLGILFYFSRENVSQETKSKGEKAISPSAGESLAVEILPEKQQRIGVKKTEVRVAPFRKVIRTVGRITYDERKLATVNIKVEGWIEKLYADYQGKYVKKGEKLAEVYSPELYATQLEFINLLNWKAEKAHRFQRTVEFNWGDRYGTTGRIITFDIEALFQVAKQKLLLWEIPEEQIKKEEETKAPM